MIKKCFIYRYTLPNCRFKAFLRKPYETLLTIDIVCHGVFSSKLVALEVEYWENLFNGKLSNLRFRSKRFFPWSMGGVVNFDITDSKGKTVHVERHAKSSPTYRCFAYSGDGYSYNIRPSCYSCPFRGKGRYGDLTVGDAWGLNKKYPQLFTSYNMRNGVSILICNTMKGVNVGNKIESFYDLYAIPVESVLYNRHFCQQIGIFQLKERLYMQMTIYLMDSLWRNYSTLIWNMKTKWHSGNLQKCR